MDAIRKLEQEDVRVLTFTYASDVALAHSMATNGVLYQQ